MIELSDWLLNGLQSYGAWVLGATTLLSALGLPLPATMLLVAAGALARQGTLDWAAAVALAAAGASLGDAASYWMGRSGSRLLAGRMQTAPVWQRAHGTFQRWGGLAIFLSRFALTPLALPVNLIAGSTRYATWRFLTPMLLGELLWAVLFISLGYVFVDQWAALSEQVSASATYLVACAAALAVTVMTLRRTRARLSLRSA